MHARPTSGVEHVNTQYGTLQPSAQYGTRAQTACNDSAIIVSISFLQCSTEQKQ